MQIDRRDVNIEALDDHLRRRIGDMFKGLSTNGEIVSIHLSDDVSAQAVLLAEELVQEHDPAARSLAQQERYEREMFLEQARYDNAAAINLTMYQDSVEEIRILAQKVMWLEEEIRDLRGL